MCFFIAALVGRKAFMFNEVRVKLVQNNLFTYFGCNS